MNALAHSKWISLPTENGDAAISVVRDEFGREHAAVLFGSACANMLVRIHSECLTGDVFSSCLCDCGTQLKESLKLITQEQNGLLIYLRQEGRGIGLFEKILAYDLQKAGYDTVSANQQLGHPVDNRSYEVAAAFLQELHIDVVRLITNNPHKIDALQSHNIMVSERVPLESKPTEANFGYLMTKYNKMGHLYNPSIPS